MTNPPPLVSAAADVLQQEGVIDVPSAELRPGNLSRVTDEGAGRQPAVISVMTPLFRRSGATAACIPDPWRTGRLPRLWTRRRPSSGSAGRPPRQQPSRCLLLAQRPLV